MTDASTGDLFEVGPRLALKPVVDFGAFLREAFGEGPCGCLRCVESCGIETGYEHRHTLDVGGVISRRFAKTTASDVLQAQKKACVAYFKPNAPVTGSLDMEAVKAFVTPTLHERLRVLAMASGLAKARDGELILMAISDS